MKLISVLFASVLCAPVAKPGAIKDVTDQVFPSLTASVHLASMAAVKDVKIALLKDTDEFIAKELSQIPLLPQGVEDKVREFLNKKVVNKVGDMVADTVSSKVTPAVNRMLTNFRTELYFIDKDMDDYLVGLHNRIRSIGKLPPQ